VDLDFKDYSWRSI